jgi:D-3-phosphoglycerate dehydrogenase
LVTDADYVMTGLAPIDAHVIAAMNKARIIARYGIGVDNIDLEAASKKDIPVCNVPDYCIDEVADHTMALILGLTRQIACNWDHIRLGEWKLAAPVKEMRALRNMTVGLVAFGRIGREVAARLRSFKCRILVFDPIVDAAVLEQAGCLPVGLGGLLAASDLVSLHCPSTLKARGMINRDTLAQMKEGAFFVNASRGALVNTEDLIAALKDGRIAGAALDVTDPGPIPKDSPLLAMSNVIISPHAASVSVKAMLNLRLSSASAVACAIRGEKLPNVALFCNTLPRCPRLASLPWKPVTLPCASNSPASGI